MNKICTSIEQSKKLMELGLDANTADIIYEIGADGSIRPRMIHYKKYFEYNECCIPSWSLSALLELMPFIKLEGSDVKCEPKILKYISGEYLCSYEDEDFEVARLEKSPLDAAFEMMCWLLENKIR